MDTIMKIAIASDGPTEGSIVSSRAGRAPYYLIFNNKGELLEKIDNPFAVGGGGAGFGVAHLLASKGVNVVISARFGPNMLTALREKGIRPIEMSNLTVQEAISSLLSSNTIA